MKIKIASTVVFDMAAFTTAKFMVKVASTVARIIESVTEPRPPRLRS